MDIFVPYLHYIGIMSLMGALITEHLMMKPGLGKEQIKALGKIDMIYGLAAVLVLVTGLIRWFWIDPKGAAFFNTNPLFHIKVTLFVIMAIISIFPTLKILKWNRAIKRGEEVVLPDALVKKQLMLIRIQLLLLVIIPLLAVMVAMGVRM